MALSRIFSFSFVDERGIPYDGGELYSFVSGSTEPAVTYSDPDGNVMNTNPVILDARGCASVYVDSSQLYRFVLKDTDGRVKWFVDKYSVPSGGETGGISGVKASVDNSSGIPSVDVGYDGSTLSLSFRNLKGEKGERGLQGAQGEKGEIGEQGPQGIQGEKGEKGEKGDNGVIIPAWAHVTAGSSTPIGHDGYTILNKGSFFSTDGKIIDVDKINGNIFLPKGTYSVGYIVNVMCTSNSDTIDDIYICLLNTNTGRAVDIERTMAYDSSISKNIKCDCSSQIFSLSSDETPVMLGAQVTGKGEYAVYLVSLSIMKIG